MDMRKPQDYFGRMWSTAFRAAARDNDCDTTTVDDYDAVSA